MSQPKNLLQSEFEGKSIVLRGSFNPVIFHPSWFSNHELVRAEEAEQAEIDVVSQKVTAFGMDWVRLHITEDRLQATTTQAAFYEALRDLVVGTLETLAAGITVKLLGMNHDFHFRVSSEAMWHRIGHVLAPKENWQSLSSESLGLRRLVIEGGRSDGLPGYVHGKVEPSLRFPEEGQYGVYISLNDHVVVSEEADVPVPDSAIEAADILSTYWTASIQRALSVANDIMQVGQNEDFS